MNNKKLYAYSLAASVLALSALVMPAQAMLSAKMSVNASSTMLSQVLINSKTKADSQIQARIKALNDLNTRLGQMVKISADEKASLSATIQSSISDMTTLQAKIDADTDAATLKTDIQSITKSYRIYALVLPQGRIIAAGDRAVTIVGLMTDLSAKLQTRIAAAQTAGNTVTTLNSSLSDMNAKSADANVQAQAAVGEVATLQPDNGVQSVMTSNDATLKDARAKIKVAIADLKTARQDAGSIVKALEAMKITASASMSATTTTP